MAELQVEGDTANFGTREFFRRLSSPRVRPVPAHGAPQTRLIQSGFFGNPASPTSAGCCTGQMHEVVGGSSCPSVDRKSTRLNSSHANISYAVFCLKKNNTLTLRLLTAYI